MNFHYKSCLRGGIIWAKFITYSLRFKNVHQPLDVFSQDFPWRRTVTWNLITYHNDTLQGAMNLCTIGCNLYVGTQGTPLAREAHRKEGSLLDLGTGPAILPRLQRRGQRGR